MKVKDAILSILEERMGQPVSGEELADKLSISRQAVWKHVEHLREEGYLIESTTNKGYVLKEVPDLLLPAEVGKKLKTSIIGRAIKYFKEVESTNKTAESIAEEAEEGTVVIAEVQTQGRGRMGRKWVSPKGGIWISIILKPRMPPAQAYRLTIIAGLSAAKTLRRYGIDARVKWPNDVIIKERKVCGVLTEMEAEVDQLKYAIVGIGIDVNIDVKLFPEEIRDTSTSLQAELGHSVDRVQLLQRLLENLEFEYLRLQHNKFPQILNEWRGLLATVGKYVQINTPTKTIYGEAVGVDSEGALIVECRGGFLERILAGECIHLKRAG
jgi:BirA family biotin operon repressor/biotin-[acetyl-CoA-carboxylase] ligase